MARSITLLSLLIITTIHSMAIGGVELTLKAGLTIPNNALGRIYNSSEVSIDQTVVNFNDAEASAGYTVGIKGLIPLSEVFHAYAHIGIHQTGETIYTLYEGLGNDDELGTVTASQFIVPVGVGMELHFLEIAIADLYITGQFNLNYLTSDVEFLASQLDLEKDDPSNTRMGYGLGVGSNFDLKLIEINTELLFHTLNSVLSESDEDMKTLVSLTVGLTF